MSVSRQRGERYFLKDAVTVVSVVVKRQCNLWLVTKDKNPDKHYVKSVCNIIHRLMTLLNTC